MTDSIGIDIVEVSRIRQLVERHGERFLRRVYGSRELLSLQARRDRFQFLAGRFAAKEAAIKALGKYLTSRPPYQEIEIISDNTGQPRLEFSQSVSSDLKHLEFQVSIAHERSHAVAIVTIREIS